MRFESLGEKECKRKVIRERKLIRKRGYKSKARFKDKTIAEREHMFAGTFSFAQEMEGSTTDGIYRGLATFSSAAASATAGASTSDANLEEEQVCEGYETDEMKSIHDEDSDNESMEFKSLEQFKNAVRDLTISIGSEIDFVKNDNERVRALCVERDVGGKGKGCSWAILC
ncbi:hypothetical protein CRG98_027734 [Punica granatum]|uniref:Transposase MuDR plant domain-containing protein n=1 Tax=Punica granatum TaxID=22663 RepID=A0A2I0J6P1_PUNGR|nr:hypothetical protein CRG98_027734 [Punica granatum]